MAKEVSMLPNILQRVKDLGHRVFEGDNFDLNIIGERCQMHTNAFDDVLHVVYKVSGLWQHEQFKCTTDPGFYYLQNPSRVKGTAILMPGQYKSSHTIGLHKGKYTALVQRAPVKVYRDPTRDNRHDIDATTVEEGLFGINIHKAGTDSTRVDKWSAGCTVIANAAHYERFINLCDAQVAVNGWREFTYTLIVRDHV